MPRQRQEGDSRAVGAVTDMANRTPTILAEIDSALAERAILVERQETAYVRRVEVLTILYNTIWRLAPPGSSYRVALAEDMLTADADDAEDMALHLEGVLRGLRYAYANGYFSDTAELIHGDMFADFLEMAEYLHAEGYKDAAAVIAGGVLEQHLRHVCQKHRIDTKRPDGKAKRAEAMNEDLSRAKIYSLLDQKNVTAWLDLRNKAAHARYSEYTKDQVAGMIQGVRELTARCPA